MKTIYIAGPYRADTTHKIQENIADARLVAAEVWKMRHVALCPHLNSANMDGLVDDEVFLKGGLVLLEKCDAVMVVPGKFHRSKGTMSEISYATTHEIPVFYTFEMLGRWLDKCES